MIKTWLPFTALLGAVTVAIGAFGAHALKPLLEANQRLETFETASKYQFYHVLALVATILLHDRLGPGADAWLQRAAWAFVIGIVFFSGSLYTLSLSNITKLGAVAPIGGLGFILGWVFLAMAVWKS